MYKGLWHLAPAHLPLQCQSATTIACSSLDPLAGGQVSFLPALAQYGDNASKEGNVLSFPHLTDPTILYWIIFQAWSYTLRNAGLSQIKVYYYIMSSLG